MHSSGKRLATFDFLRLLWSGLSLVVLLAAPGANAQALDPREIPESLKPWIPWILAERGDAACTQIGDEPRCVWPGELVLTLDRSGGRFEQNVFVESKKLHRLPGDPTSWPLEVEEKGKKLAVLEQGGLPHVELARGGHTLSGRFSWRRLPETLAVGAESAFVELSVEGRNVPLLKRDGAQLWLKGLEVEATASGEAEHVELDVFRKLSDGVPLSVETRLVFQVAGRAREIQLPNPLVQGTVPLSVSGDLAVALEPSGALRVQLTPGRHELVVVARSLGMPTELRAIERPAPWPSQEVWVFEPQPALRVVELSGAPGIDASRTVLPAEWKQLGAYAVEAGATVALRTTRRGEPQLPPNRINLRRELWLDEAAEGFTVRDALDGEMHQNWRLDLVHGVLGQVTVGSEPQVITENPENKARGIELRDAQLRLSAISRVPKTQSLAAVGWSSDVDSLNATLHLPPGWDVFAASGVDTMSNTWVQRWDLFAVFYVLVLTLATSKLVGKKAGAVALAALILSHAETDAPEYIWIVLIILSALASIVRSPRLSRVLRWSFHAVTLTLAALLLSFAVEQVRHAIYPHLETASLGDDYGLDGALTAEMAPVAPSDAPEPATEAEVAVGRAAGGGAKDAALDQKEGGTGTSSINRRFAAKSEPSSNYGSAPAQKQFQPGAVVQTGPGVPDVASSSWDLAWSGPVAADHSMTLYLISPTWQRVLTVLRLASLGILAFLLWRSLPRPPVEPKAGEVATPKEPATPSDAAPSTEPSSATPTVVSARVAVLALVALCVSLWPTAARADEPSSERLEELRARLNTPAVCEPECLSVSRASLKLGDALEFTADVHAGRTVAYKLPGPASALAGVSLSVDGKPTSEVRLEADGAYYLRLEAGVHRVVLEAQLPSDRTTLDVGSRPHFVSVDARGWAVSGVNDDGRVEGGTLTLIREMPLISDEKPDKARASSSGQINVPPWFSVTRQISLGVNGRVTTTIRRVSDATSPEVLNLPLLPGEQVTTPSIEVRGQTVLISFPREVTSREFSSTLGFTRAAGRSFELALDSPAQAAYSEVWTIECGVVWHCQSSGLATTSHVSEGRYLETFSPWPSEKLTLRAVEPRPASGQSLTIERSTLTVSPGIRMRQSRLEMTVRTSRSQIHAVRIPAEARLERVEIDGSEQASKNENGTVRLSLGPGSHQLKVQWQEESGLTTMFRTSAVDLGATGTNTRIAIEIPGERWLLLAGGPGHGPAILFWGYLVLIVAAALLLPLLPFNRLTRLQWLLLGLGLTQVPAVVAIFVVGWFFLIGSRRLWQDTAGTWKNVLQVTLVTATVMFLIALTGAVYQGLVISPDMEVRGAGSHAALLAWYVDKSPAALPSAWFVSVSIWVWRAVMLAWALWLSRSLLIWLRWAWAELHEGGFWAPKSSHPRRRLSRLRPEAEAAVEPRSETVAEPPAPEQPRENRV